MHRYPCEDCGKRFTTGRARSLHQCGRPTPPQKRARTVAPSSSDCSDDEATVSAVDGLFKIIEIPISTTTPAVVEELQNELDRFSDILR